VLTPPSGLIASVMSRADTSLMTSSSSSMAGSPNCPWSIRLADYQRVTLAIVDFSIPKDGATGPAAKNDVTSAVGVVPAPCLVVVERSATGNGSATEKMVCGNGRDRETIVYRSKTNIVDVHIGNTRARYNATGNDHEFIVIYEGNLVRLNNV
jgi:hypothetical protein